MNKYDWGIYTGISGNYEFKDKETNINNSIFYMLNRSMMIFKYDGLPDTLPKKELEKMLQVSGYCFIMEVDGDLYGFTGGLGGERDAYNRPTEIVISNPALKLNKTVKLSDGVLIKNDDMTQGLIPIYAKYSSILAENEITMILANVNKRVNNLISVSDDTTAESARQYLKKLMDGDIGFIFENKLYDSLKSNTTSPQGTGNLQDLFEFHQYMKASMYNEIGLNANFNMKRSRLVSDEVELNLDSLYPLIDNMLEQRVQGLEQVKEKFGVDITVEFTSSWEYRAKLQDTSDDTDDDTDDDTVDDKGINTDDKENDTDDDTDTDADDKKGGDNTGVDNKDE